MNNLLFCDDLRYKAAIKADPLCYEVAIALVLPLLSGLLCRLHKRVSLHYLYLCMQKELTLHSVQSFKDPYKDVDKD